MPLLNVPPLREELLSAYARVRATTEELCEPLQAEDMVVQTMPDVSPTKWHLAHVTWFFETLVLARAAPDRAPFDPRYHALFNSYYQGLGQPFPRARRGLLSRPTVTELHAYRRHVDAAMATLLERCPEQQLAELAPLVEVGLHHEQQHQELLLMDIKHVLATNPLQPTYAAATLRARPAAPPQHWCPFAGGVVEVGAPAAGFAYDNERPRHTALLQPHELASRLVTAGEFLRFVDDDGYRRPELWLADGWDLARREGWQAPLYWQREADGQGSGWQVMTLAGLRALEVDEPVCHVSFYEADAYARWAGARLPSELEWEHAAAGQSIAGTFLESGALHPRPLRTNRDDRAPAQLYGDVWEWTTSPYAPYPGFRPFDGALSEYNGKFMVNQLVLRGGCCVTPRSHVRPTYRNFYYPQQRWMFAGFRLARS